METPPNPSSSRKKNLSNDDRLGIFQYLLQRSENGKLKKGSMTSVVVSYGVSTRTISRIWKRGKESPRDGSVANVSSKFAGKAGRKRVEIDVSKVLGIAKRRRKTIRSLAHALKTPKSTLHLLVKEGLLRRHTNAVKPHLTSANKISRLNFCLSKINQEQAMTPKFEDMMDVVHVDEKWFFLSKEADRYYLLPEECEPYRTCKSKRYIPKIMFLAAVARPRTNVCHGEFSGKIGIFPFTEKEIAIRNSKNRLAGTLETKPVSSITKSVYRTYLIEKVIPAIQATWPRCCAPTRIYIQQDNAKPHISPNDPQFVEVASRDGLDIRLCCQPPNSPDLNVLDLGYFRAIQSLQQQEAPSTIEELVEAVQKSFEEISYASLNRVFLTLQQCMIEIIKDFRGNKYKIPHMRKNRLERQGILPIQLECGREIIENAYRHLQQEPLEELVDEQ